MSTYLAGKLCRERLDTPPHTTLAIGAAPAARTVTDAESAAPPDPGGAGDDGKGSKDKVTYWVDAMAALVPAEVLALHGLALSFGTTTTGSGEQAVTTLTYPGEMRTVYVALILMAVGLYVVASRRPGRWQSWAGAAVAAAAFVTWTMLQPSTAFDAVALDLSSFARTMTALFAAVVLGAVAAWLARQADASPATT